MKYQFKAIIILILLICVQNNINAQKIIPLKENFNKLIVSPHIEAVFVQGDTPSIEIKDMTVPLEKLKYEFYNDNTLQVYLEDAKTYTKHNKNEYTGFKKPVYKGRVAQVVITYTDVNIFSVRGEEETIFESPIEQHKCTLRFYGDSKVTVKDINVDDLIVEIYGSSFLTMEKGAVKQQKIRAYGESIVMAPEMISNKSKITVYGDGKYQLNVSDELKVTAYGESKIFYKGNAFLKKGIIIGDSVIRKID